MLLLPQRVSYAKTTSHAVEQRKGKAGKGKPPRPPKPAAGGEAAAGGGKEKEPAAAAEGGARPAAAAVDVGRPNSKLFVEELPGATTAAMLDMLFQQFPGEAPGGVGAWAGCGAAGRWVRQRQLAPAAQIMGASRCMAC